MITEKRKIYLKKWRSRNKDKIKKHYKRWLDKSWSKYYKNNKEKIKSRSTTWNNSNKDRVKVNMATYYKKNKEKIKNKVYLYRKTEAGKSLLKRQNLIAKEKRPLAVSAKRILNHAIENGKIKKEPCVVCGSIKSQGHHPDYNFPLKVKWLCAQHHKDLHTKLDKQRVQEYN